MYFTKKFFAVFLLSFALNFVWENLHFVLYDNYMGGEISRFILFRASVVDAAIISVVWFLFLFFPRGGIVLATFLLVAVSVFIELWALDTGRWAYNELMPVIPLLGVGLSPAVQLAATGFLAFKISDCYKNENKQNDKAVGRALRQIPKQFS